MCGRRVPQDWDLMDLQGKKRALISYGYAADWMSAGALMGQHSAAVRKLRAPHRSMDVAPRHWMDR